MEAVPDDELERIDREIARIESEDISAHPIGYLMGWADWHVERLLVLEERKKERNESGVEDSSASRGRKTPQLSWRSTRSCR